MGNSKLPIGRFSMAVYLVRFKEIIAGVVISFLVHMWLKFIMSRYM